MGAAGWGILMAPAQENAIARIQGILNLKPSTWVSLLLQQAQVVLRSHDRARNEIGCRQCGHTTNPCAEARGWITVIEKL